MGETSLVLSWIIGMTILGLAFSQATTTQETDHCIEDEGVQVPEVDDSMKQWIEDGLAAHNEFRKKHGVPPLTLNLELCKSAQWTARWQADKHEFIHTDKILRDPEKLICGENLYYGFQSSPPISVTAETAVRDWYDEIKDYDYDKNAGVSSKDTGHFTQVIWKDTHEMCMVFAKDFAETNIYVVAHYYPRGNVEILGNIVSEYAKNVPRPLNTAASLGSSLQCLSFALILVSIF